MINLSAITPHPPISIPGIGEKKDLEVIKKTIASFKKLGDDLAKAEPDTIVLISPHAPLSRDHFLINSLPKMEGSFFQFGLSQFLFFKNDLKLVKAIQSKSEKRDLPVKLVPFELDHGALVPLHYLTQKFKPRLVHLSFSLLTMGTHFRYGEVIGEVFKTSKQKIALIASGDLSHRLTPEAPAGFTPEGQEFDQKLINLLKSNDTAGILGLDDRFIEAAGECGLRSIIILLGALKGLNYKFDLLSYEGPFGVGYLVAKLI